MKREEETVIEEPNNQIKDFPDMGEKIVELSISMK